MIFLNYPFKCNQKSLNFDEPVSADLVRKSVETYLGYKDFSLYHNGRKLQNSNIIPENSRIQVTFSLCGGKGGFGSMLRAIGAQIEKTTNREACRDLSGRRLRDINEEQRLKKWISKEAEREAEKVRRRQQKIERLKSKTPHKFFDFEYEKEISQLPDRISDALNEGLQKAKLPQKRPHENAAGSSKLPKKAWLTADLPSSDSDSEDSSPSKKPKVASKDVLSSDSDPTECLPSQPSCSRNSLTRETSSESEGSRSDYSEGEGVIFHEECSPSDNEDRLQDSEMSPTGEREKDSEAAEMGENNSPIPRDPPEGVSDASSSAKQAEVPDDSPIELLDYRSAADLEILGLDRLKSALLSRGLKCGGNLSDRAQRLWKVRGLQPHQYPPNLLAKSKK